MTARGTVKKIGRMFRQHDVAPEGVVSPLYRQLTREWADLHSLPSTETAVRRWVSAHPVLAEFARPGDVVDAIDAGSHAVRNELLLALIDLFQHGHQLAGRTVLQAMLPKLARISHHVRASSTGTWEEDARHITLAEFWDIMAAYPTQRRTRGVAANLALDTLHRVSGVRRAPEPVPVDPGDFRGILDEDIWGRRVARRTWLAAVVEMDDEHPSGELCDDADLQTVIAWGVARAIISRSEADLLTARYLGSGGSNSTAVAATLGLTPDSVRQRCSRATRKLTEAVRVEMAAPVKVVPVAPTRVA